MAIPTPIEFWTFNNTRVGIVGANELTGPEAFTTGIIGQALDGNGIAGRSWSLANFGNPGGSAFSVSLWVRWVTGTVSRAFCYAASGDFSRYWIISPSGGVNFAVVGGSIATSLVSNVWSHHAFSWIPLSPTTSRLRGWKDGLQVSPVDLAVPVPNVPMNFYVLRGVSGLALNADIDCLGVWNVELTDQIVAELYNAGAGWEYEPTPPDNTPDAFSFANVLNAEPATQYVSDSAEVTGMDAGTEISVTGGEYRVNGGAWTSDAGTIDPGDTLELRATSSADPETETIVAVTVGTLTVEWSISTAAAQTLKQHLIVSRDGIIQPVGACVIVPGWV